MAATFSPTAYQEGITLDLQSDLHDHGPPIHYVLKLYDRRFGSCLREVCNDRAAPHTQENEAAFEDFVRRGMMPGFLRHRKERNETENFPVRAREFLDEPDRTEGLAKYEAPLWQECIEHFECETKAYHRLTDLQGTLVPRLHAHVSLSAPELATIIPQETAPYFEVRGILLERIDGYGLENLTLGPLPQNLRTWHHIIHLAVDAAHEINKRGVIMEDCAPRNVVVDEQSQTPRIVDLAQCNFRDEMVSEWYQWGWHEDEDWDPDVEYWEQVGTVDNPGAIEAVMATRVQRRTGVKLDFRYPDWSVIIAEIRRREEEAAAVEPTENP